MRKRIRGHPGIVDKSRWSVHSRDLESFAWTTPLSPVVDMMQRPLIWVLKGARAGDTAQAMELALQLDGRVEGKQLSFNALHTVPNWVTGARISHLSADACAAVRPPWPDLVVATGKRTAPVALWIRQQSGGHSKLVQLGRPRMALRYFDLVVTTPQYGLPAAPNVMELALPFAHPRSVAAADVAAFSNEWSNLPRPWILGVIGGHKFPLRLNDHDIAHFGQALAGRAQKIDGSVILLDSPRSPEGALDKAAQNITTPKWLYRRGQSVNPYQTALQLCDELVVTSDSVSMVSEMLHTGKPTSIYRLPVAKFLPRWSAKSGLGALLARAGVLHPPRDVDGFMTGLVDAGFLGETTKGDVMTGIGTRKLIADDTAHEAVIARIKALLKSSISA
jgi:uncharacterized protein